MPGVLTLLHRCITSSEFAIYLKPDEFKFVCPFNDLSVSIVFHDSCFEIFICDDYVVIKYKASVKRPGIYNFSCEGNYNNSQCAYYFRMFYRLYFNLINDYIYPTLSSIKLSQIHIDKCSKRCIDAGSIKLTFYDNLVLKVGDVLEFKVTWFPDNPYLVKIVTSMLDEVDKNDCSNPKRVLRRLISRAKALL